MVPKWLNGFKIIKVKIIYDILTEIIKKIYDYGLVHTHPMSHCSILQTEASVEHKPELLQGHHRVLPDKTIPEHLMTQRFTDQNSKSWGCLKYCTLFCTIPYFKHGVSEKVKFCFFHSSVKQAIGEPKMISFRAWNRHENSDIKSDRTNIT